ncbi:uncharacterized protein LOC126742386 [Anthonomus grandis grandis]|uniref:uncharacterized protein LOC126742386 n=1 Tax=Anthonomus grandis grandis TaxID=2921223 RepID=UPI0021658732|nr:uncharacterized protein LOC126742386 [Anthonomus grandis grandis]
MRCAVLCVVFAVSFALVAAGPVVDDSQTPHINSVNSNEPTIEESLMKKLNNKCSNHDISSCMMLKLVTYFNRMLKKSQIELGDIEITQTSTETTETLETSRSLKDFDQMSEEAQLSTVIGDKLYSFIKSRSMKWHVTDVADVVVSGGSDKNGGLNLGFSIRPIETATEEGRKKKDQGNNMGGIMAAVLMKIGLLKALAFKALVILVGKALLVSKLALVLAGIIGLKKLLSQEKHVTYEVVPQAHHDHHEHHVSSGGHDSYGGPGWGRTFDAAQAQKLAYGAQVPDGTQ